jgi:hypothetical protein
MLLKEFSNIIYPNGWINTLYNGTVISPGNVG